MTTTINGIYTETTGDKTHLYTNITDLAKTMRKYVKEKYPAFKFSITSERASCANSISIALMEAPKDIYVSLDELLEEPYEYFSLLRRKRLIDNEIFTEEQIITVIKTKYDQIKLLNTETKEMIKDIEKEVRSYNHSDSDPMTDYHYTNFYFNTGVEIGKWDKPFKVVTKEAKAKTTKATASIDDYAITETTHTKTGKTLYKVTITKKLTRDEFKAANEKMKELGGYYSRFLKGFAFNENPASLLTA